MDNRSKRFFFWYEKKKLRYLRGIRYPSILHRSHGCGWRGPPKRKVYISKAIQLPDEDNSARAAYGGDVFSGQSASSCLRVRATMHIICASDQLGHSTPFSLNYSSMDKPFSNNQVGHRFLSQSSRRSPFIMALLFYNLSLLLLMSHHFKC